MSIRHLALVPAFGLMVACGGSAPEPETPATEAAGAAEEAKPAEEAPPAEEAKPAEGEAAHAEEKPAEEPAK